MLLTECAHRPPGALRHRMELVRGDKLEALLRLLAGADDTRTIVFCRGVQSARAVALALEADGFRVSSSHGSMPERMRRRYLADFVADDTPRKPILVSTDLAARGLNLPGVEHIVNFDFPASAALYLHRAGRAGRMGAPGRVTSLLKRSEVPLGEAVQAAIGRRAELPPVRAAPKAGAGATEGPALPAATTTPSARELSAAGARGSRTGDGAARERAPSGVGSVKPGSRCSSGAGGGNGGSEACAKRMIATQEPNCAIPTE